MIDPIIPTTEVPEDNYCPGIGSDDINLVPIKRAK